jgi:glucokinase
VKDISREVVIGIDLGGSAIRAGVVTGDGRLRNLKRVEIPATRRKDYIIASIRDIVKGLILHEKERNNKAVAIGIGSPGIIKTDKGIVVTSPNFPAWRNVPLKSLIRRSVNLPVVLDNDANSAAFGEKWKGAGRRVSSLVCLTMGTGIGGGIILNNDVWYGANGMGGEIGHITVDPDGPLCNCGNYGCLEAYSSATAMVKSATQSIGDGKRTILNRLSSHDPKNITAKMIYEAATQGDRLSISILNEAGKYLGIAIASLINILNPEMIVLTGAVTGAWDYFMPAAIAEVEKRAYTAIVKQTKIVKGKLPGSAGVIGAAGLAFRHIGCISCNGHDEY